VFGRFCSFSVSVKPHRISGSLSGEDDDTTMLPSTAFRGSQAKALSRRALTGTAQMGWTVLSFAANREPYTSAKTHPTNPLGNAYPIHRYAAWPLYQTFDKRRR